MTAQLKEGDSAGFPFTITEKDMAAFEALSGDANPIHVDASFARRHGLAGRVVYGGLIVAMISRLIGMKAPGTGWIWHSLSVQFRSALFVGEPAELTGTVEHVNDDLGVLELKLKVTRGADVIATGKAQSGRLKT